MMQLSETEIDAPPELVWEVPTDPPPTGNGTPITAASDAPHEGSDVRVVADE